jgi:hypothetical protein
LRAAGRDDFSYGVITVLGLDPRINPVIFHSTQIAGTGPAMAIGQELY